jgi:hypothetical protein
MASARVAGGFAKPGTDVGTGEEVDVDVETAPLSDVVGPL